MSIRTAKPEHEVAYQDLCALVNKHADKLTALELLAVASNMLGKLIALQDQRITSSEEALQVVSQNIELGNQQVFAQLQSTKGNC